MFVEWFWELVSSSAAAQGALYTIAILLLGMAARRVVWLSHVKRMAVICYYYAEEQGLLKGLQGAEKLVPFMERLKEEYFSEFGQLPTPKAIAIAVEKSESKVLEEHLGK